MQAVCVGRPSAVQCVAVRLCFVRKGLLRQLTWDVETRLAGTEAGLAVVFW